MLSTNYSDASPTYEELKNSKYKMKPIKEDNIFYDQFKNSITSFIHDIESTRPLMVNITTMCIQYKFQKRRFYDVLNVLEAVGCCHKLKSDSMQWFGLSNISNYLIALQQKLKVNKIDTKLEDIFQADESITISKLTQLFILCFLVIQNQTLNIKQVAQFLSRHNKRYKTTLCKLYQITHILEAAGVLKHLQKPCIISMDDQYFSLLDANGKKSKLVDKNPYSVANLLNDHQSELYQNEVKKRKYEFFSYFKEYQIINNILYK